MSARLRALTDRLAAPPRWLTRSAGIAAIVTQAGIAVTGSIVRVTGSGLGCPTWPRCFEDSLTPRAHDEVEGLHQWVEFGNRLLTGLVGIVALICLALAWYIRPRRRRLVALALTMPIGVAVQAVVGGITVLTDLKWWTVAVHFLISMVLVWLAVLLLAAFHEGDARPQWFVPRPLQVLMIGASVVLGALLVAGTLVTAAGPHAGDEDAPRLDLEIPHLAQLHADLVIGFLGMLVGLGFALWATGVPRRTWQRYSTLVAVTIAQGVLGAVQYALEVPEVLVSFHVLGAALVVVAMAGMWTGSRERGRVPGAPAVVAAAPVPSAARV